MFLLLIKNNETFCRVELLMNDVAAQETTKQF